MPGLYIRQTRPGSKWQFDLFLDSFKILSIGWDEWARLAGLLQREADHPGSTELSDYPLSMQSPVAVFRKLHLHRFATRRDGLQALQALLVISAS